jgi:hypothetical protein
VSSFESSSFFRFISISTSIRLSIDRTNERACRRPTDRPTAVCGSDGSGHRACALTPITQFESRVTQPGQSCANLRCLRAPYLRPSPPLNVDSQSRIMPNGRGSAQRKSRCVNAQACNHNDASEGCRVAETGRESVDVFICVLFIFMPMEFPSQNRFE